MDNRGRAMEVIHQAYLEAPRNRGMDDTISPHIAESLAGAGLLMPDLPQPMPENKTSFRVGSIFFDAISVQAVGDQVAIHGSKSRHGSIQAARSLAYALLAASNLAEQEQNND